MRGPLAVLAVSSIVVAVAVGCHSSLPSLPSSPPSLTSPLSPSGSPASLPSSSKQAGLPLPDAAALLKQSSTTTKNLKSVHLALAVTGKVEQMPVKTLDGELTNRPGAAAKGNATVKIMGSDVGIRFVVFGGHLYVALPGEGWSDFGPTANVYDVTAVVNPDTGLANMLADFIDPKVEARETIGGQQTIRVVGKVTADAVDKLVPQLAVTKRMACTVWVQESGDHQLVRATLEPSKDDSVQMTLSDWNAPVTVEKPAGA